MKPLFIPLKSEWFDAFASGKKKTEYRRLGGPWNAKTCSVGRTVVLSRGYGKQARLRGRIIAFRGIPRSKAPLGARALYPDARLIARIDIALD